MLPLSCPVRGCGLALAPADRTWRCEHGHSFDIARGGYLNLLQPQDRRAAAPGDTRAAVAARAALLQAGVGTTLLDLVAHWLDQLARQVSVMVDLGSGSGDALGRLAAGRAVEAIGIDISTAAALHASRAWPHLTWVVANADRRLPLLDGGVDLVLSLHARRNPADCARVIAPGGHLLVAVPAPDDLVELRAAVQGDVVERDRVAALVAEHASAFEVSQRLSARETRTMTRPQLHALLAATYRGARASAAARVDSLDEMTITLASEVVVFRRKAEDGARSSVHRFPGTAAKAAVPRRR